LTYDIESAPMMMIWSVYNTFLLFVSIQLCVNIKQRRRAVRVACDLQAELKFEGQVAAATVIDLSEDGARVKLDSLQKGRLLSQPFNRIFLTIPALNIHGLALSQNPVAESDKDELGLAFGDILIEDVRKLVQFVYCEPGRWQDKFVSELRGAGNLVASALRLHPFIYLRRENLSKPVSSAPEKSDTPYENPRLDILRNSA
jgi:cellulose synthase (UDP-forming)